MRRISAGWTVVYGRGGDIAVGYEITFFKLKIANYPKMQTCLPVVILRNGYAICAKYFMAEIIGKSLKGRVAKRGVSHIGTSHCGACRR